MSSMNLVRQNAYAKLNLTLDIKGKKNGYHILDSLVVTIDLFDRIVLKKRKDKTVSVTMHGMGSEGIPFEENNARKAAEAFSEAFGTNGADITVHKNIPIGAGLGGSSADAAGVLLGMKKLYEIGDMGEVKLLATDLGSDTEYLLTGGLARMKGCGSDLEFFGDAPEMYFLAICPEKGVTSKECYEEYDRLGETFSPATEKTLELIKKGDLPHAARCFSNHLFRAAKNLNQYAENAYLAAKSFYPLGAAMTGSGSAAFALFDSKELAAWAQSRYRGKGRTFVVKAMYPQSIKSLRNPYALSEDEGEGE